MVFIGPDSFAAIFNETEATEDLGAAFATSIYSKEYGPTLAFKIKGLNKQKESYWSSKSYPDMPVFIWFRFNEIQRVSRIAFEEKEKYKLKDDDVYEVSWGRTY